MRPLLRATNVRPNELAAQEPDAGKWPQVGAVVQNLDGRLPPEDLAGGSRWDLDGSAVLIAPRHVLTIGHVTTADVDEERRLAVPGLAGPGPTVPALTVRGLAVFLPSVGIVPVEFGFVNPGEERRDRLLVLQLDRDVPLPPIPASRVDRADVREPEAVGFGDWVTPTGTTYPRGVQRRLRPHLFGPDGGCTHDLCWDADKDGSLEAGSNNSGGAVIERRDNGHQVVAILRRRRADIATMRGVDVIAATSVSENRAGFLYRTVYANLSFDRPLGPPPVMWRELILDGRIVEGPFALPPGTSEVHATLSAGRPWLGELYLQMELLAHASPARGAAAKKLQQAASDPSPAGEFLSRSLSVKGAAAISIAITPLTPLAGRVRAQLCLRFVDADGNVLAPPFERQVAPVTMRAHASKPSSSSVAASVRGRRGARGRTGAGRRRR